MKTTITASCGHTTVTQIYGGTKKRAAEIAALSARLCPECYQAEINAERSAKTEAARAQNVGLPALTGSEKQIAWAETIRAKLIPDLVAIRKRVAIEDADTPERARLIDLANEIISSAINCAEAKFWIDHRESGFSTFWLGNQIEIRTQQECTLFAPFSAQCRPG